MLEELRGKVSSAAAKAFGFEGWEIYTSVPKAQRAPLTAISDMVAKLLSIREWVSFVTGKAGTLQFRLTMFVARSLDMMRDEIVDQVTAELQPLVHKLEAARDDVIKQVAALERELVRHKGNRKGFPQNVWEAASEIWRTTLEESALYVGDYSRHEVVMAIAQVYEDLCETAAAEKAGAILSQLVADGKTRPWQNRRACIELFERARETMNVFTVGTVEVEGESVATMEYAIEKIAPVLKEQGETVAFQAACDLAMELSDGVRDSAPIENPAPKPPTNNVGAALAEAQARKAEETAARLQAEGEAQEIAAAQAAAAAAEQGGGKPSKPPKNGGKGRRKPDPEDED